MTVDPFDRDRQTAARLIASADPGLHVESAVRLAGGNNTIDPDSRRRPLRRGRRYSTKREVRAASRNTRLSTERSSPRASSTERKTASSS